MVFLTGFYSVVGGTYCMMFSWESKCRPKHRPIFIALDCFIFIFIVQEFVFVGFFS